MFFKYVGEPKADGTREVCASITMPGISSPTTSYRFRAGVPVEVDDEALALRLSKNNHFEAVTEAADLPAEPADELAPKRKRGRSAIKDAE